MLFTVAADSEAVTMASHSTRIERFEGTAMPVNSYVVEGPEGLVIVDGQLTVSDARALRALIDQFNRPVAAMVLTHGHPITTRARQPRWTDSARRSSPPPPWPM